MTEHAYVVQRVQKNNDSGFEYHVIVNKEVEYIGETQEESADWALAKGYATHVARVRYTGLEDPSTPAHWRKYQ
ncbi:hypothetical protein ABMZ76_04535 [Morganella morganii]